MRGAEREHLFWTSCICKARSPFRSTSTSYLPHFSSHLVIHAAQHDNVIARIYETPLVTSSLPASWHRDTRHNPIVWYEGRSGPTQTTRDWHAISHTRINHQLLVSGSDGPSHAGSVAAVGRRHGPKVVLHNGPPYPHASRSSPCKALTLVSPFGAIMQVTRT